MFEARRTSMITTILPSYYDRTLLSYAQTEVLLSVAYELVLYSEIHAPLSIKETGHELWKGCFGATSKRVPVTNKHVMKCA